MFIYSPLEQFEIIPIFNFVFDYNVFSITNQTIFLVIIVFLILFFFKIVLQKAFIVETVYLVVTNQVLVFIKDLIKINLKNLKYFPLVFILFIFLLCCNLIGMIPYSFTITSHLFMTFFLSLSCFLAINIIGFRIHGFKFFEFFLPNGISIIAAPFFVIIELISYFSRVFSLSIRLFANLLSGHALLKVLIGFSWSMFGSSSIFFQSAAIIPFIVVVTVTLLELAIAFLQAYVFSILVSLYLNDVISLSH